MLVSLKHELLQKLKQLNIEVCRCDMCKGTGMIGVTEWINDAGVVDHSWSGEYCDKCNGLGFFIPEDNGVLFLCPTCKGKESAHYHYCKTCHGLGFIDWIENVTRRAANDWYL